MLFIQFQIYMIMSAEPYPVLQLLLQLFKIIGQNVRLIRSVPDGNSKICLLYTSDAADD